MIEVRVDGIVVVADVRADIAIQAIINAKERRPDQEVSLHDLRFDRCWMMEPGASCARASIR